MKIIIIEAFASHMNGTSLILETNKENTIVIDLSKFEAEEIIELLTKFVKRDFDDN